MITIVINGNLRLARATILLVTCPHLLPSTLEKRQQSKESQCSRLLGATLIPQFLNSPQFQRQQTVGVSNSSLFNSTEVVYGTHGSIVISLLLEKLF